MKFEHETYRDKLISISVKKDLRLAGLSKQIGVCPQTLRNFMNGKLGNNHIKTLGLIIKYVEENYE